MDILNTLGIVLLLSFLGSFVYQMLNKIGFIEYGQVYLGWGVFNCLFCLSFWSCYIPLLIYSFFSGGSLIIILNIVRFFILSLMATPLAKYLNSK